jgi:hypothetical protein
MEANQTTVPTPPAPARAPVGLAIELDNDVGKALQFQKGQHFYLNRVDLRMSVDTTQVDGVSSEVGMLPDLLLGGGLRARCRRTPFDGPSGRCYTGV